MSDISSNNKRIAKNTMMLYVRMLLSTVVSLYTSRVVLQVLGVEDYGIYGVVGGVVAMFSFLNSTMAGATSRFLTFEMGKGDKERLKDTFSSALIIHIGIALLVLILAETVGLWFLNNKLVIPEGRMGAAHWVLQFSVLGMIVGFTQVPYNAAIIAHEKMDVYAYVELIHVFLKLGIVYLLWIGNFDKLILYAFLTLVVNVIVAMIYRIYCIRHYEESKFRWVWDKFIFRPMLSFSGFNLLVNVSSMLHTQSIVFFINIFFGAVVNAASSIASTVNGVLKGLGYNITAASRPNIVKCYALNKFDEMQNTMNNCLKFSTISMIIIAVPFYLETPFIIQLWLGQLPKYVVPFIRISLMVSCLSMINSVVKIGIDATGNIKLHSICTIISSMVAMFSTYLLFRYGCDAQYAYIVDLSTFTLVLITNMFILKKQIKEIRIGKMLFEILRIIIVTSIGILITMIPYTYLQSSIYRVIIVTICSTIIIGLLSYAVLLNKHQREYVNQLISRKLFRKI